MITGRDFVREADALREQEFARLAEALPPTLGALCALTPAFFQEQVGAMFERLGHVILSCPTVRDLVLTIFTLHFLTPRRGAGCYGCAGRSAESRR